MQIPKSQRNFIVAILDIFPLTLILSRQLQPEVVSLDTVTFEI